MTLKLLVLQRILMMAKGCNNKALCVPILQNASEKTNPSHRQVNLRKRHKLPRKPERRGLIGSKFRHWPSDAGRSRKFPRAFRFPLSAFRFNFPACPFHSPSSAAARPVTAPTSRPPKRASLWTPASRRCKSASASPPSARRRKIFRQF